MGKVKLKPGVRVKQKYIMSNLVYMSQSTGPLYMNLWLENQLKSLIDPTNLPALKNRYDLEYVIFTDDETLMQITRHPNFMALSALCEITVIKLNWPADTNKFDTRYGLLAQVFQQTMKAVFDPEDKKRANAWCSVWVADLVFAKHSIVKMLSRLEEGHDAVFMVPIRSAADAVNQLLTPLPGAPSDLELFEMAYGNLHSLWTHATVNNPYFSRMPYSMCWDSGTGLLAHNFSITPIVFKPNEEMLKIQGGIDTDGPTFCKNPYWATDWTDAAVAGVEPLSNGHYPPFLHHQFNPEWVCEWSKKATHPAQKEYLHRPLYYPSKAVFNAPALAASALETAKQIQTKLKEI